MLWACQIPVRQALTSVSVGAGPVFTPAAAAGRAPAQNASGREQTSGAVVRAFLVRVQPLRGSASPFAALPTPLTALHPDNALRGFVQRHRADGGGFRSGDAPGR